MAEEALRVIVELRGQGITTMLVEQNVQNALSVADPAYVFDTGRVVAHDTSPPLLGNPDLLREYLGA